MFVRGEQSRPDHTRWVRSRDNYFLPKKVLGKLFRGKFVDALKEAFQNGQLHFHGDLKLLAQPKTFAAWLRPLHRQDWVVYLKRPFGGPEYVVHYLGRYTHRVAISNHRLVSSRDGKRSALLLFPVTCLRWSIWPGARHPYFIDTTPRTTDR